MKFRTVFLAALASLFCAGLVAQAQVPGINSTIQTVFMYAYEMATNKPTYSATMTFAPSTSGAGNTDVCQLVGSATKTIKVRRVMFGMVATTAVTDPIALVKRSTLNAAPSSGGIPIPMVAYDTGSSAASAKADVFTTNPASLGTLIGVIADPLFSVGNLTTGGAQRYDAALYYGQLGSSITLRGAAQQLSINFNSFQYAGNIANCTFEWTEDNDS
jgi:hypothetical protein